MWTTFLESCQAAIPFIIQNLIPLVNFIVLLLVIIGLQRIRSDALRRAQRYHSIEKTLADLQNGLEKARVTRFEKIESDIATIQDSTDKPR